MISAEHMLEGMFPSEKILKKYANLMRLGVYFDGFCIIFFSDFFV